jgi:hypothetical protein
MKSYVICVKYGGEVRSFGLCDNMAVAELTSMLSTVFDLETGIVGLVMPVSLTSAGKICWMFNAVIGSGCLLTDWMYCCPVGSREKSGGD